MSFQKYKAHYIILLVMGTLLMIQLAPAGTFKYVDEIPFLRDQEGALTGIVEKVKEKREPKPEIPLEEVTAEQLAKMIAKENQRAFLRVIQVICLIIFFAGLFVSLVGGGQRH